MENGEISKNLKYMCHTTKNLDLIRVFLKNTKDNKNTETGTVSENKLEYVSWPCSVISNG